MTVLNNMNEQYIYYSIYSPLLMLVNENTVIHCVFIHSALTSITFDFNNALVNAEITMK